MSNQSVALNSVSIGQASELMYDAIFNALSKNKIPPNINLIGAPGTAKSASVIGLSRRLTVDLGKTCEVIDIRLGAMESSDVQGIPYNAREGIRNGEYHKTDLLQMFFSTPAWWPNDPNKNYILFLDELPNAPSHVQQAAYRLILDRSCQNGTVLPDNVAIIAAGNRKEDKTGAKPLIPAAANRFAMHLLIDQAAVADEFVAYAMNSGWDRTLVGFLAFKTDAIYQPPNNGELAFPTQRSWEFANDHITNERIASDVGKLAISVASAVGSVQSTAYMGFREYYGRLPDWKKIRRGEETFDVPRDDEGMKFAIGSSLASEIIDCYRLMEQLSNKSLSEKQMKIEKSDILTEMDNLCNVIEQIPTEMQVVMFKMTKASPLYVKFLQFPRLHACFSKISQRMSGKN